MSETVEGYVITKQKEEKNVLVMITRGSLPCVLLLKTHYLGNTNVLAQAFPPPA